MRFLTIAPLLLAALLLPPLAASAKTPPSTSQKSVSLDVGTADLHALAAIIEYQAGIKIWVVDSDKPYRPVSVHLIHVTLFAAMKAVAASAGAEVTQDAKGIYVFMPTRAPKSQDTAPPKPHTQFSDSAGNNPPGFLGFGSLKPSDAFRSTHWLNSLGWPKENYSDGIRSRSNLGIEAPEMNSLQPSGIKRIYAL